MWLSEQDYRTLGIQVWQTLLSWLASSRWRDEYVEGLKQTAKMFENKQWRMQMNTMTQIQIDSIVVCDTYPALAYNSSCHIIFAKRRDTQMLCVKSDPSVFTSQISAPRTGMFFSLFLIENSFSPKRSVSSGNGFGKASRGFLRSDRNILEAGFKDSKLNLIPT